MTNPGNAVGTNAAYGGRTSTNAFNDVLGAYTRGVLNGWQCVPKSGLTVSIGGDGATRDVAIAEDNIGDRTTINNISGAPIDVTIGAAPGANSRIDAIVAYVDNPAQGDDSTADNPAACGLITVKGTASSNPVQPTENAIRTAITSDGASGPTAYYVVLATVTIASGTTDIDSSMIKAGTSANKGEVFITMANSDGSFTLPPGYSSYHIRGEVQYGTSSSSYGLRLQLTSNVSTSFPTAYIRRIIYEQGASPNLWAQEYSQADGVIYLFGTPTSLGSGSGGVFVDLTLERDKSDGIAAIGTWHHSKAACSGFTTSGFHLDDKNASFSIEFSSANRTFSNSTIVITGIKE